MNRQEYFESLLSKLPEISGEDREQILGYYEELICDGIEEGRTEEEMLERLGEPERLAGQMREEWELRKMPAVQGEEPAKAPDRTDAEFPVPLCRENGADLSRRADTRKGEDGMRPADVRETYAPPYAQGAGCCERTTDGSTELEITAENQRVEIVPSPDRGVHIYYPERLKGEVEWYEEDNRLIFRQRSPFRLWGPRLASEPIVAEIPGGGIRRLRITVKNGAVSLKGQILEEALIKTSNGGIKGENLAVREFTAEASNAPVEIRSLSGGHFRCATVNGRVSIERAAGAFMEAHSSNGGILLKRVHTVGQEAVTSNGRIVSEECKAARCSYQTRNGKIELEALEGSQIDLRTSNAPIHGSIRGRQEAFDLELHTSNGRTVPETCQRPNAGGKLFAKTSNSSIRLAFTEH